jgi:hypothetical protein
MTRQSTQIIKSLAGSVLVGPGLSFLTGYLDAVAARWHHLLGTVPGEGLGLLSSVILAASFNPHQLLQGVLQLLSPALLLVVAGALLLWDAVISEGTSLPPTCRFS